MSESEILNDLSQYKFEFTNETGLDVMKSILDGLMNVSGSSKLIESDEHWDWIVCLVRIGFDMISEEREDAYNLFLKNKQYAKIVDIYLWLIMDYKSLDFEKTKPDPPYLCCYKRMTQNERKIYILCWTNRLVNWLMARSDEVVIYTIQKNLIEYLLLILEDYTFIDKIESHLNNLGFFLNNLSIASKNSEKYMIRWQNANAMQVLRNLIEKYPDCSIKVYGILVMIAFDSDLEKLTQMKECLDCIVDRIVLGMKDETKTYLISEITDKINKTTHKFRYFQWHDKSQKTYFTLRGSIELLYRISVNNKAKKILYDKPGLSQAIKEIFYQGNEHEKSTSLDYFAQLCFDNQINADINKDKEFVGKVEDIIKSPSKFEYKPLVKSSEQLIWLLEKNKRDRRAKEKDNQPNQENNKQDQQNQHIMISYNRDSRDLCLKIKKKLEEIGGRVWIDVTDMQGSTLEAMAQAVENAQCVLVCVTEKYRQSINCQAEAQYAFKLQKKIVPLVMQEGYGNVGGWLGLIMGDKMFIDFTKYKYDECIQKLLKEINIKRSKEKVKSLVPVAEVKPIKQETIEPSQPKQPVVVKPQVQVTSSSGKKNDVKKWNEMRVEKWFNEMGLKQVYEVLKPLDGATLHQLYEMKMYTPELFFQLLSNSMKNRVSIDLKQPAHFSVCLVRLFQSNDN